jgi:two-component system, cell cycle sensor histidine kinase and response regulator CckA
MLRASIPTTVKIHTKIKKGLPPVLADPTQIQQIIMNLCTNAGQVMEAEGGTLTFTLDSVELDTQFVTVAGVLPPGQYVRMQVRDTGPGIPPEIMERLFDPFFTTKGVGEGTGLGLAVVHGIVQDRKGGIIVESEEGLGTTFSIYLPASGIESVEVTVDQKKDLPRGTERILFVDDEPMIMKLGQHMLERQGYMVEARASGTDALECFRQDPHRFDLVVTDMTMPGLRGDRLAEEIMAIRPDIPVILCTGYSKQISKEKAREIGVRAFVMKPLTQHELASTVRKVLDEKPRK